MNKHEKPEFRKDAFKCPHCGVFSQIKWHEDRALDIDNPFTDELDKGYCFAQCECCKEVMCFTYKLVDAYRDYWGEYIEKFNSTMLYPKQKAIPPTKDMPEKIKEIYEEASLVLGDSPRASCALLRLALQELMIYLKENIKEYCGLKIGNLKQEIEEVIKIGNFNKTQEEALKKTMDSMRLVGNKAVHPSELDLNDSPEIAGILFEMLNFIVEEVIAKPVKMKEQLDKLDQAVNKNSKGNHSK